MSTKDQVKRGWKNFNRDKDRINQKQMDIINDDEANPWVREAYKLDVGLTDLKGEQIKKIKKKK